MAHAEDCSTVVGHAAERACLEHLAAKTDAQLQALEKRVAARIALWDQEPVYIHGQQARLKADERAYRDYREAACEFDADAAAGGNGAGDTRLQCRIDLDRARIARLKTRLDWFGLGD
jgi:uncharacterized protein YecT (DUF1311 family)